MSTRETILRHLSDAGRLMVGLPPYDAYKAHMAAHHPDLPVMDEVQFFRDRQNASFGEGDRGGFRCC